MHMYKHKQLQQSYIQIKSYAMKKTCHSSHTTWSSTEKNDKSRLVKPTSTKQAVCWLQKKNKKTKTNTNTNYSTQDNCKM